MACFLRNSDEGRCLYLISNQEVLVGGLSVANASHNLKNDSKRFITNSTIFYISVVISDTSVFHMSTPTSFTFLLFVSTNPVVFAFFLGGGFALYFFRWFPSR